MSELLPPDWRHSTSSVDSFEAWETNDGSSKLELDAHSVGLSATRQERLSFADDRDEDGPFLQESGVRPQSRLEEDDIIRKRLLLGLACAMSLGSHYGANLLGPIKHSMKTSESDFSLSSSAAQAIGIWVPEPDWAIFSARFGAAKVGLFATGSVAIGLLLVVYGQSNGDLGNTEGSRSIGVMIAGLFIFGLGLSPISVVQESIILKQNSSTSTSVARSVAAGLILGKLSSFVGSYTAEPLSSISPRLPFVVGTFLALLSFSCCVVYAIVERRSPTRIHDEDNHRDHGEYGRWVPLGETVLFGDTFWLYILACFFAGVWYVTHHLATSLLISFYDILESQAAPAASQIVFSALLLYPIIGFTLDKRPHLLIRILSSVPILIALTYCILLFFAPTVPYLFAPIPAALGIGCGPLLMVVVVPRIVERHQTSTALGLHKSIEMAGAVLFQTITGNLLSSTKSQIELGGMNRGGSIAAVKFLLALLLAQVGVVLYWCKFIKRLGAEDRAEGMEYGLLSRGGDGEFEGHINLQETKVLTTRGCRSDGERSRGVWALRMSVVVIFVAWIAFMGNLCA